MNQPRHIAVISAGMAGLSCASALQQAGLQVSVFDKSGGPSGRMSTRRGDGWQCDHGAQYFTARDPQFRAEVALWEQAGAAALWCPVMRLSGDDGALSGGRASERFVGTPRMTAPAALLAASLTLHTNTAITGLRRDTNGWRLQAARAGQPAGQPDGQFDGHIERPRNAHYDAVVLAVPAPQAVPLLQARAPELAALAALAAGARMHACWAMMLRFEAPLALGFDAAFVDQGPLRWVARDSSKPGRDGAETWLLHASAAWSDAHTALDADSVAAQLLPAFAALGGALPHSWSAHRWLYASTEPALTETCAWDAGQGLGLCGDWLNGGTVEAAWLSGRALAQRIVPACT